MYFFGFGEGVKSLNKTFQINDQIAIDQIAERTAEDGYKIQTLLKQVVLSEPFLSKTNPKTANTTSQR